MKPTLLHFAAASALCSSAAAQSSGGPWTLRSSTHDSGGQSSSSGPWKVTGTLGQPDATAATSAGGAWSAHGGFWPGVVNVPGGPLLAIIRQDTANIRLIWTETAVGYKLQHSADLQTWTDTPGATITGAGSFLWAISSGPRYSFRLKKIGL